ncbi:MAG: hypothetical protein PVJ03_11610 [Chromatiaceae bacterium]|jgi:hypothetical protein
MTSPQSALIPWESLSRDEQIALRERYGHYLDNLPPTCSLDTKVARFKHWLEHQGIAYDG